MFTQQIRFDQSGDDVRNLQLLLKDLGYFPSTQEATGTYGNITSSAVYKFQNANNLHNWWEAIFLRGPASRVGPKTLQKLNDLIKS